MRDVLFDEVFRLLEEATRLEKSGQHRIEAATKYYESCYLMRQIVATAEAQLQNGSNDETSEKTIGVTSCQLLKEKIDHYTIIARKLYFNQPATIAVHQPEEESQQKPATSVMIGLLDDAISVITETQTILPPAMVPVLGYNIKSPDNQKRDGHSSSNFFAGYRPRQNNKPRQQSTTIPSRTPRCALAAIERRIHLRANLAHSALSKAIDLDERHSCGFVARKEAIAGYVEASELYLSAIQLGKEQECKLATLAKTRTKPSTRSCSSAALIERMQSCLKGLMAKLKRLLGSALDRVEALKKEEEKNRYPQQLFSAVVSMSGKSIVFATPVASNVYKSSAPVMDHWFSAKENDKHQINKTLKKRNATYNDKMGSPGIPRQSPTTVLW